jgi:hypothetical protein
LRRTERSTLSEMTSVGDIPSVAVTDGNLRSWPQLSHFAYGSFLGFFARAELIGKVSKGAKPGQSDCAHSSPRAASMRRAA